MLIKITIACYSLSLVKQLSMEKIDLKTQDGTIDCYTFKPGEGGKYPVIIMYMDAYGPRAEMFEMCDRLARNGYFVVLPNLYYRAGEYAPFDPKTAFSQPDERERLMKLMQTTGIAKVIQDTASIFEYLDNVPGADSRKVGCVGYCMGGKFALTAAAAFPDRVKAAASFHGGSLATDKPDSPHLLASKMYGRVYIGVAGMDKGFTEEEKQRLENALRAAEVRYKLEVYQGAAHGFAVNGTPVFDRVAAEKHWDRLFELFAESLT